MVTVPGDRPAAPPISTSPPAAEGPASRRRRSRAGTVAITESLVQPVAQAVRQPLAGGERPGRGTPGLEGQRRPQAGHGQTVDARSAGSQAVQGDAAAHQVVAAGRVPHGAGRVGGVEDGRADPGVRPGRRRPRRSGPAARPCTGRRARPRPRSGSRSPRGAGGVAIDGDGQGQLDGLLGVGAHPVHPGVHLDVHGKRAGARSEAGRPAPCPARQRPCAGLQTRPV